MFAIEVFFLGMAWEALVLGLFSQPLFWIAYFSFYTSLYPSSNVHVQVQLFRADTCPISPYPKWLGVVVKTEKYGSVRRRVFNCSNNNLLLGPLLHCARPFFQEHSGMPRTKSSSAISLNHLDFHCMFSVMPLLSSGLGP